MFRIRFQDTDYVFVGDSLDGEGAIATEDDYSHGRMSYAHLMPSGEIKRFGKVIGQRNDIQLVEGGEPLKVKLAPDAWDNLWGGLMGEWQ